NIYEFATDGAQSTFGSGGRSPHGLAFDIAGNLFVAALSDGRIYKFTPDGARSEFASGAAFIGLAFNSASNLFSTVPDLRGNIGWIYQFAPDGTRTTFATLSSAPSGLAFDGGGNLFVAATGSGAIYKITPDGAQSIFASGLSAPYGLAFDGAGDLFEADLNSGNIYEFTPEGVRSTFASGSGNPTGIAFGPNTGLADTSSPTVQVIAGDDLAREAEHSGSESGPPNTAEFVFWRKGA